MGEIRHVYTNAVADGTATSVVRPSDWNSGHAYTMQDGVSLGGNTAGVLAPISSGTLILAGGNNITLSQDGNSVTMLGAAGGLTTAMASNRGSDFIQATVGFNGTNISGTFGSNSISLSVAAPGLTTAMASNRGSDFVQAAAVFAGTNASGTIASGGVSVSVGNYITTAMASNRGSDFVQANATIAGTSISGTIASNGLSLSVGPYLTTAMASNRGSDFVQATATIAGTSITGTIASNGLSLSVGPYITTGALSGDTTKYVQNWKLTGNTAGTTSSAQGTDLWFSGGNSITVSGSSNSIRFSVGAYITTAMASNRGSDFVAATAAFAGTSASGTIASNGISVSIGPYITTAMASNRGSDFVAATAAFAGTSASGTIASNGISVSIGAYITTAMASNRGSDFVAATAAFAGTNLSGTIASGGVSVAGWPHQSYFANVDQFVGVQTMTMLQSTSGMFPFVLGFPLSVGFVRLVEGWNVAASSTAATTGNTVFSAGHTRSHNFVIYSRGVGANSMSLQYVTSSQVTQQQSINVSANANSTQFSYTNRLTLPAATGNFGLTKDYSSSAASLNFHTSNLTDITGTKLVDYPFAFSLAPGQYFFGYGVSSSVTSQFTNQITRMLAAGTNHGVSQANSAFGTLGGNTNSSVNIQPGIGSFSFGGAGGTTSSVDLTRLSSSASQNLLYFQFMGIA